MNENLDPERDSLSNIDLELDKALRPMQFDDFCGQPKVVENLKVFVSAAKMRSEALDHVLLHGPPGLGKTTLSNIIALKIVKKGSSFRPNKTRFSSKIQINPNDFEKRKLA